MLPNIVAGDSPKHSSPNDVSLTSFISTLLRQNNMEQSVVSESMRPILESTDRDTSCFYDDIKSCFDEIDRRFGSSNGADSRATNSIFKNCEMHSPISETSDYGESENDQVPIWEQHRNSFEFPLAADYPDLIDSGFVLIYDLLSALGVYTDYSDSSGDDEEDRVFDGDFEIL